VNHPAHRGDDELAQVRHLAAERAGDLTRRSDRILREVTRTPFPAWGPLGAVAVLVTGTWLFVGQWVLSYPFTVTGQDTAVRDTGFAVVVILAGFRLLVVASSRSAAVTAVLMGALLTWSALAFPHEAQRAEVNELVCGITLVLGGAVGLLSRRAQAAREPGVAPTWSRPETAHRAA
jgi:hypothetical protein